MSGQSFSKDVTLPDLVSPSEQAPPCPKMIGPYKIDSLLTRGGMSFLYLGAHPENNKPLAVKVLSPRYVKNQEVVDRFLKEAHIIAMTNHPNIIKLYGEGKWEHGLYIAMEFIQGVSLRQFILQKSLSRKRALEIILQVAYALCHLHAHGVIHRDLKPENIIITESGRIKVIDFGIAQLHDEIKNDSSVEDKRLIGTPVYMSPEQKQAASNASFASDIYSLGIIMYELVLGRLSHGVVQLSLLPKALQEIVSKALKTNPEERYADIVDLITDISHYLKNYREEKELEEEESADELIDSYHESQKSLIAHIPKWPQIEFAASETDTITMTGMYVDFFSLSDHGFAIFMAEPVKHGLGTLVPLSTLRGMARQFILSNKGKAIHPVTFLSSLNEIVADDPTKMQFACSMLILNPEDNQLSFCSCSHNNLCHILSGSQKASFFATPNPPLGKDRYHTFVSTASNWNVGDKCLLFSLGLYPHDLGPMNKNNDLKNIIKENAMFSAKGCIKKIDETMRHNAAKKDMQRIAYLLGIERTY